jgi:hypothetical protein
MQSAGQWVRRRVGDLLRQLPRLIQIVNYQAAILASSFDRYISDAEYSL